MSKSTISTFQLFEMFPTAESARLYLESRLWPDGPFCPEMFKQPKVPIPRVKVQASDLAAQFLASLRRDDAQ
jgi:hypothetical protein